MNAAVIGASHIITYNTPAWQMTEVFACVPLASITPWTLDQLEAPLQLKLKRGLYEFTVRRITWDDPEPPDLVRIVTAARSCGGQSDRFGIVQEFSRGDLEVTPKTVIFGLAKGDRDVVIETAHSYPNVRGLVMSRTRLHFSPTPEEGAL